METLKKSRFAWPEIFLRCEADLDFSRHWFSDIKVQIKRPHDVHMIIDHILNMDINWEVPTFAREYFPTCILLNDNLLCFRKTFRLIFFTLSFSKVGESYQDSQLTCFKKIDWTKTVYSVLSNTSKILLCFDRFTLARGAPSTRGAQ